MNDNKREIKCPNCQTVFTIDESQYQDIVSQVRKEEFNQELDQRIKQLQENNQKELALVKEKAKVEHERELANKDNELTKLQTELVNLNELKDAKTREELAKQNQEKDEVIQKLNNELVELKNNFAINELKYETDKKETLVQLETKVNDLKNDLILKDKDLENQEHNLRHEYDVEIKLLNDQIETYKNFKAQQSTKMIGESLEQYAYNEFNKVRAYAFPNAYFEKDNDAADGTKGDFIYRENDENGIEILSIMFEMKNEADTTATKHKNADFYKKLDVDRKKKNCEYAVLVTMLEADNELFNVGIVDVSYEYEKMYVIRPQLFIQMIGVLRNAALSSLKYRQELANIKERDLDITNFESEIVSFKDNFLTTAKNFNGNLEKLDKNLEDSIRKLTTARDELRKAMKNLGTAENKLEDLSVKRLTKNNPTMKEKFDEIK